MAGASWRSVSPYIVYCGLEMYSVVVVGLVGPKSELLFTRIAGSMMAFVQPILGCYMMFGPAFRPLGKVRTRL